MKPFDEYWKSAIVPYAWEHEFKGNLFRSKSHAQRLAEINDTPMTAEQRTAALAEARKEIDAAWEAHCEARSKDQQRIWKEFLQDCRDELKYSEFLTEEGCRWLESQIASDSDYDYEKRSSYEIYWDNLKSEIADIKEILSYVKAK